MTNRDSSDQQLSPTNPWTSCNVPGPSAGAVGDDAWSAKAHEWDVCCVARIQQCPLNSVLRYYSTWPCIVLGCQLNYCLAPVLLRHARQFPTTFFFDSVWTPNTMSSTAGFTVIHPLCISTNNCRSRTTHESCSFGNTCFESLQYALYQSHLDPQPFPSHTEVSEIMILQTLQQQLNTTST
ncbi:uncharacterized protein TNCV_2296981 [Trichonephila clavipes]|nr:uncharacterized protein TNCV_2296981 [Trichonephila clavipes]